MRKSTLFLILIFIAVFVFRLVLALKSPAFSYDSYFHLRQIGHIASAGIPLFHDTLSYGGRSLIFMPVFHYLLAFFNLFLPLDFVAKVLPNLFSASAVFAVYLITEKISKKTVPALFAAAVSGFVPIFIFQTINSVNPFSLAIPLIFFALYFLMMINQKAYLYLFLITSAVLVFVSPITILLIFGMLLYLLLIKIEGFNQKRTELEAILFTTFFVFWVYFIVFKKIFLVHGPAVIWQNIPKTIAPLYFANLGILEAVFGIGLLPFLLGIYMVYKHIFVIKDRNIYLLLGFVASIAILLWCRLISTELSLVLIGVTFTILFGQFLGLFREYIEKTRFFQFKLLITIVIIILVMITSIVPSYYFASAAIKESAPESTVKALEWLKENKHDSATVAASVKEGHLVSAIAEKKNIADFNFVLIRDVDERLADLETIFTSPYKTNAVELLNKYQVKYILLTEQAKIQYGIKDLIYAEDRKCFKEIYDEENTKIYQSICEVEEFEAY
jgi:hypothetical protein